MAATLFDLAEEKSFASGKRVLIQVLSLDHVSDLLFDGQLALETQFAIRYVHYVNVSVVLTQQQVVLLNP